MRLAEPSPFELYLPKGKGPFPLICLTPILGRLLFLEDLFFERRFARFFASRGFAAALIERPIFEFNPQKNLEQIQDYLDQSVARNQRVLDSLVKREEIDLKRIGSFGISFGAVANVLWAARDTRLKANVFALGGGNLPEILTTSRDPLMRSYITEISKATGLNGDELKNAFQKVFQLDPLQAASSISGENVLLILALFDRVIPFRYGQALREKLGKPKTIFLPLGHYTSLLVGSYTQWRAEKFFKEKLGPVVS